MTIIFDIFPSVGHQQASYKLAKLLQENGNKVIYIGKHKYLNKLPNQFERQYIQPHLFKAIFYYSYKIPVISIQTAPASNMNINIPPFNSPYIPSNSTYSKYRIKYLWMRHLFGKQIRNKLNFLLFLGEDHLSEVKKLAKEMNFPLKQYIDFNHYKGYGEFGLKNIPQLLLSPKDFDFPYELKNNQYAIGPLYSVIKEEPIDNRYLKVLKYLLIEKKIKAFL